VLRREFIIVPNDELTPEREAVLKRDGFGRIGAGMMGWLFGRRAPSENEGASAIYDWCGKVQIVADGKNALRIVEAAARGLVECGS
jgi:hypothetical protein